MGKDYEFRTKKEQQFSLCGVNSGLPAPRYRDAVIIVLTVACLWPVENCPVSRFKKFTFFGTISRTELGLAHLLSGASSSPSPGFPQTAAFRGLHLFDSPPRIYMLNGLFSYSALLSQTDMPASLA